jgi:hypothetical protein
MTGQFRHVNLSLVAWARRKYKRLAGHRTRASIFLETISRKTRISSHIGRKRVRLMGAV